MPSSYVSHGDISGLSLSLLLSLALFRLLSLSVSLSLFHTHSLFLSSSLSVCVSLCPPSLSLSIQTHVNCTSLLVEKQTAVLLAAALGNNVAEMCGNHQAIIRWEQQKECHLNLQVDPTNQDDALRGGKWTVSSQRSGHIMMGKDRQGVKTMHSLIHTASNPEQMPVVGWQQQERKEFDPVSYAKRQ